MNHYPPEYRLTRCLQCSRPLAEHRKFTQADIDASAGATWANPRNGYWSPLSPSLIGRDWVNGHAPMPWPEKSGGPKAESEARR